MVHSNVMMRSHIVQFSECWEELLRTTNFEILQPISRRLGIADYDSVRWLFHSVRVRSAKSALQGSDRTQGISEVLSDAVYDLQSIWGDPRRK